MRDRFRACLLGGAVGDALGYTVKFWSEDTIRQKYGADGITDYELDEGIARISDDTQMTLFTANGLLLAEEDNAREDLDRYGWRERISEAYADWLRTQQGQEGGLKSWLNNLPELNVRRAPGGTCLAYLAPGSMGSMREPRNDSKGCGGVMRVAPVALYFHSITDEERLQADLVAAEAAAITHGHELGYIPAAVLVHMLQDILYRDFSVRDALHDAMSAAQTLFSPKDDEPAVNSRYAPTRPARHLDQLLQLLRRAEELADTADVSDLDAIHTLGEGWVAEETLAIAVFCALRHEDSFEKAVIAAVNHKGDSDSTGSVAGILMGARLGLDAIPDRFLQNLELEPVIEEIADDLLDGKSDTPRWKAKYQTHECDGKK
ncbi:MAG: ADP-ribosylglycohydrolase family protein [Clostridia bacterium]|nr:ADP-ribosylglycohydrolase family protein [Clostridia bacterium]